jgi:hypothetical protein
MMGSRFGKPAPATLNRISQLYVIAVRQLKQAQD